MTEKSPLTGQQQQQLEFLYENRATLELNDFESDFVLDNHKERERPKTEKQTACLDKIWKKFRPKPPQ